MCSHLWGRRIIACCFRDGGSRFFLPQTLVSFCQPIRCNIWGHLGFKKADKIRHHADSSKSFRHKTTNNNSSHHYENHQFHISDFKERNSIVVSWCPSPCLCGQWKNFSLSGPLCALRSMFRSGGHHISNSIMWTRWRTASLLKLNVFTEFRYAIVIR